MELSEITLYVHFGANLEQSWSNSSLKWIVIMIGLQFMIVRLQSQIAKH